MRGALVRAVSGIALFAVSSLAAADWRAEAMRTMRIAVGDVIARPATFALYRGAGFNTVMVFDAQLDGRFRSEEDVRATTTFARVNGISLIVGLAVQQVDAIPEATDDALLARVALWKSYGDEVIVGVSPWYDDVFLDRVPVDRQRHVYALLKSAAPDWYVFGIVGEFGMHATADEVAQFYDPAAFDQLAVLLYPFNIGGLDAPSSNELAHYVDGFFADMNERYFTWLKPEQNILLVVQAFSYPAEPFGRIPRADDVRMMVTRGAANVHALAGQRDNASIAYCCWGADGSMLIGIADRPDLVIAARDLSRR